MIRGIRSERSRLRAPPPLARTLLAAVLLLAMVATACTPSEPEQRPQGKYPWHTNIVATTFWVGEVFDPNAADGSQVFSTYDSQWMASYGGCDGRLTSGGM